MPTHLGIPGDSSSVVFLDIGLNGVQESGVSVDPGNVFGVPKCTSGVTSGIQGHVLLLFHVLSNTIGPELHRFLDIDDPLDRFGLRELSNHGLDLMTATYRNDPGNGCGTFREHSKVAEKVLLAGVGILCV